MGSTYVDFRGWGFEANDSSPEVWLALLVDEIEKAPAAQDWLRELRDGWELQATAQFGFGVMPGLDRVIISEDRRTTVLALARRAFARLQSFGDPIPRATLNAIRNWGEGSTYAGDVAASKFLRPASYFIKLLEGTRAPEEIDARFAPVASAS